MNNPILARGMGGIGDTLHTRAIVRKWIERGHTVYLQTSYPEWFWDMRGKGLYCLPLKSDLRHAKRNEQGADYDDVAAPAGALERQVWYTPRRIEHHGSFLKAMAEFADADGADDISLPIKADWRSLARVALESSGYQFDRPLLIVRPPTLRSEWINRNRNPLPSVMPELLEAIRARYFVIGVADLSPGNEWLDGDESAAMTFDATFLHGQLHVTTQAAIMAFPGSTVLAASGYPLVLGKATWAWTIGVFGGHDAEHWVADGCPIPARWCGVRPIDPCECMLRDPRHTCRAARKLVDMPAALAKVTAFADQACAAYASSFSMVGA